MKNLNFLLISRDFLATISCPSAWECARDPAVTREQSHQSRGSNLQRGLRRSVDPSINKSIRATPVIGNTCNCSNCDATRMNLAGPGGRPAGPRKRMKMKSKDTQAPREGRTRLVPPMRVHATREIHGTHLFSITSGQHVVNTRARTYSPTHGVCSVRSHAHPPQPLGLCDVALRRAHRCKFVTHPGNRRRQAASCPSDREVCGGRGRAVGASSSPHQRHPALRSRHAALAIPRDGPRARLE